MTSTRKESVRRHSRRFHPWEVTFVVPFIDYVAGLRSGIYQPRSLFKQAINKSQSPLDKMVDEFNLETARQAAKRYSVMNYGKASVPTGTSSPQQSTTLYDTLFGLTTSTCPACRGVFPVWVLFNESPETSARYFTHDQFACPFPAMDQDSRNRFIKATKEASASQFQLIIENWTFKNPCLIALKLSKTSETSITLVRKTDYSTKSLTMPKSSVLCGSMPPSNSALGILLMTAVIGGKISLSDKDVSVIIAFFKDNTFGRLDVRGYGEYLMVIVPEKGSDELHIQQPKLKTGVTIGSQVNDHVSYRDFYAAQIESIKSSSMTGSETSDLQIQADDYDPAFA